MTAEKTGEWLRHWARIFLKPFVRPVYRWLGHGSKSNTQFSLWVTDGRPAGITVTTWDWADSHTHYHWTKNQAVEIKRIIDIFLDGPLSEPMT